MKILVDKMPENEEECLLCDAYTESPKCRLPGTKDSICVFYWTDKCPYLTTKENKDD